MRKALKYLSTIIDKRQEKKVLHKIGDIIVLVFFAMLANANEWVEMEIFGKEHEEFLRRYLELPNGIPSHDTIQRVFSIVSPESLSTSYIGSSQPYAALISQFDMVCRERFTP